MKKSIKFLMELLDLKEKDRNGFMDKLFEAITTDYLEVLKYNLLDDKDAQESLKYMIEHFEQREEYEKCDILLKILNN